MDDIHQVNRAQLKDAVISIAWLKRIKCSPDLHWQGTVLNVENLNLAFRCRTSEAITSARTNGFGSALFGLVCLCSCLPSGWKWGPASPCFYLWNKVVLIILLSTQRRRKRKKEKKRRKEIYNKLRSSAADLCKPLCTKWYSHVSSWKADAIPRVQVLLVRVTDYLEIWAGHVWL